MDSMEMLASSMLSLHYSIRCGVSPLLVCSVVVDAITGDA